MTTFIQSAQHFLNSHGVPVHPVGDHLECKVKVCGHVCRIVAGKLLNRELGFISIVVTDLSIPAARQADVMELVVRANDWFHLGQVLFYPDAGTIAARIGLPLQYGDLLEDEINMLLVGCDGMLKLLLPRLEQVLAGTVTPAEAAILMPTI